jgi:signal transduction histidine kinase/CheY-like chemotaxis protein
MWQDRRARAVAVAALALAATTLFAQTGLFDRLRWWAYDWQQAELPGAIDLASIAVIDIDDRSIDALEEDLGPWPFDRDVYARVNHYLRSSGAKAIGYHLTLTESRPGDERLAATLADNVVLGAMAFPVPTFESASPGERLARESLRAFGGSERWPHQEWKAIRLPSPRIDPGRPGRIGIVNHHQDDDGTVRRLGMLHGWGPHVLPSLPLATLLAANGFAPMSFQGGRLRFAGIEVPLDRDGEALVRFPADARGLNVVSFHALLNAAQAGPGSTSEIADAVRGRLVLIGRLLPPAGDYLQTPIGLMSGLELTALGLAALKGGQVLAPARWWIDAPLVALALTLPILLVLRGTRATPREFLAVLAALTVLLLAAGTALFAMGHDSTWVFAITAGWMATALAAGTWFVAAYDERRQLELETRAASEANRLKTEFLNHLTHELRTPLTAIMGFNKINQLTDDLGKGSRIKNSEVIGRNCQHLLALINNHLDLAKIAAGTLSLAPTPEDPEKLCRDAIDSLRSLADEKRLRLRFVKRTPLPSAILLDAARVRQILINLIGNALKFTQTGSVELVAAWHVAVLQLEIRDTGPGIPRGALERIFEPFEQADATVAARFGGTGLGLTIARKLVDLMEGAIDVESEVGVGTTFRVRFPTQAVTPTVEPAREPASLAAAREPLAGRVLVAEDNEDIRALVQLQLRRLGVDVTVVADGFAAVDAAMSERYDVVLMDLEMPIMNGFEAVNVLRTRGYPGTIFALTAYHSGAEAERAVTSGCDAVVTKPTSVESLRAALATVLPGLPRKQTSKA